MPLVRPVDVDCHHHFAIFTVDIRRDCPEWVRPVERSARLEPTATEQQLCVQGGPRKMRCVAKRRRRSAPLSKLPKELAAEILAARRDAEQKIGYPVCGEYLGVSVDGRLRVCKMSRDHSGGHVG